MTSDLLFIEVNLQLDKTLNSAQTIFEIWTGKSSMATLIGNKDESSGGYQANGCSVVRGALFIGVDGFVEVVEESWQRNADC